MTTIFVRHGAQRAAAAVALAATLAVHGAALAAQPGGSEPDLASMALEDLMEIEVTTVSKRAQRIADSPAAVYVISEEDIQRSGVTTLPELLRMVPGLHVAQIDATHWSVASRGFAEEFSNKLLVMLDGRSIYTPIFSGVMWNEHDVPLQDIERIEVVRGPGGTLWGANAVNGVIHIISKPAARTQGLQLSLRSGSTESFGSSARWGGALGDAAHYRIYGGFAERDAFEPRSGNEARDDWRSVRSGGRLDWNLGEKSLFTLQGNWFRGDIGKTLVGGIPDQEENRGGNVLARLTHAFSDTSSASVQAYWDATSREQFAVTEDRDTLDFELQHGFQPLSRHRLTWGLGHRASWDRIDGSAAIGFADASQTDHLSNVFLQDEVELVRELLRFTLGSKFEHNDYTGFEIQPSARLLLTPHAHHSFWAAVSRAVRTPSRSEEDVIFSRPTGPADIEVTSGDEAFRSEKLIAYEAGYRALLRDDVNVDLAVFYNDYAELRTSERVAVIPGLPTTTLRRIENRMRGESYGFEASASWLATDSWRLMGSYTYTDLDLERRSGSSDLVGEDLAGATPQHMVALRSFLNLPGRVSLDGSLGWVDQLESGDVDSYFRLDLRLAWRPVRNVELSLVGLNLIEEHREFGDGTLTQATRVPRSVYGAVRWSY